MNRRKTQRTALALALSAGLFGLAVAGPADAAPKNRRQQAQQQQSHEEKKAQQQEAKEEQRARRQQAAQEREQRQAEQQAQVAQRRAERQAEGQRQRQQELAVQQQERAVQQQRAEQRQQQVVESQRRAQERRAAEQRQVARQQESERLEQQRITRERAAVTRRDTRQPQWQREPARQVEGQRLSTQRQQELITVQRQRRTSYATRLESQQRLLTQQVAALQQQRRFAQYRYQQQYLDNLRRQRLALQSSRYDYYRDPYFYTAPSYQYSYSGRYYQTNRYGVDLLREALNLGYREGYLAAQADRQDRWGYSYRDSFAYRDANYGYDGLYVEQSQYNYYFREGFRRGYDDAYYSRFRYGHRHNGQLELVVDLLDSILRLRYLN